MSTDYQKYDYFSVGNTPEELKSAVINNCTSCDVGEDDNDCLELITQDHLIKDAKDLLVHNHYMRALDDEKPKKGVCYAIKDMSEWVLKNSDNTDPVTKKPISDEDTQQMCTFVDSKDQHQVMRRLIGRATNLLKDKKYEKALDYFNRANAMEQDIYGFENKYNAATTYNIANAMSLALNQQNNPSSIAIAAVAEKWTEALKIETQLNGKDPNKDNRLNRANIMFGLANVNKKQKEYDLAFKNFTSAGNLYVNVTSLGEDHKKTKEAFALADEMLKLKPKSLSMSQQAKKFLGFGGARKTPQVMKPKKSAVVEKKKLVNDAKKDKKPHAVVNQKLVLNKAKKPPVPIFKIPRVVNKVDVIKTAGKKSRVKKAPVKKAPDKKALDKKAPDKKALDKKALDKKAPDKKALDKKALDKKALDKKALDKKAPVKKAPVKKTAS